MTLLILATLAMGRQGTGELSAEQALSFTRQHAQTYFGISLDTERSTAKYLSYRSGRHPEWRVITARPEERRFMVSHLGFYIDAADGHLRGFINYICRDQQYRKIGRTGREAFSTEGAWRSHIRALAHHLGVPDSASLDSITWKHDGEVKDSNSAGYVAGKFRSSNGKLVAIVNCDPQDGVLVMFTRED